MARRLLLPDPDGPRMATSSPSSTVILEIERRSSDVSSCESIQERCRVRARSVGFVFQAFHLLPHLTALDNVIVGARVAGLGRGEAEARALEALRYVGLASRIDHRPSELSGGEQQRVAIARVLAARPRLVLADEPTGNLDRAAAERVMELLVGLRSHGAAVVLATHAHDIAAAAGRELRLEPSAGA
jgi:predicted ABC-type transport system involved in lysophospholipase L1 biosynthesis ATPase subunit